MISSLAHKEHTDSDQEFFQVFIQKRERERESDNYHILN